MSVPHVLVVEDDPSIQRFIGLALDEEPLELRIVSTAADAIRHLRATPVQLLLTDLMLPGASGADLMATLRADPALGPVALIAVVSAGLDPRTRDRLHELGAWRLLAKPVSVQDLLACVRDALSLQQQPGAAEPAAPVPDGPAPQGRAVDEAAALHSHFGGNAALFAAFKASCRGQFPQDLADGERALAQEDWSALRRLGHSLKSVFATLGHAGASRCAGDLEAVCVQGDGPRIVSAWQNLARHLAAKG